MARWTASAKWAAGPALDGQRAMPLGLSFSEWLGLTWAQQMRRTRVRKLLRRKLPCHVTRETVQDRLPAGALLFFRMGGFTIESDGYRDTGCAFLKLDDTSSFPKSVLDELQVSHLGVLPSKVESE